VDFPYARLGDPSLIMKNLFLYGFMGVWLLVAIAACQSTTPTTVAYKVEGSLIATVNTSMLAWADWVKSTNGVTVEQINLVQNAYETYYQAQLVARDAVNAYLAVNSPDNSNSVVEATSKVGQSGAALVSLIANFRQKGAK